MSELNELNGENFLVRNWNSWVTYVDGNQTIPDIVKPVVKYGIPLGVGGVTLGGLTMAYKKISGKKGFARNVNNMMSQFGKRRRKHRRGSKKVSKKAKKVSKKTRRSKCRTKRC